MTMATILTPEQLLSRERFSKTHREMIANDAARDETKPSTETTVWKTIRGAITNLNYRYTHFTGAMVLFEWDMHDLWDMFIQSAQVTDADDAGQDRLVGQVLYARAMGTLSRETTGQREEAITHDGFRIWTELPYLVHDVRKYCANESMQLLPAHRRNLAASVARLVALDICGGELSLCALCLLRETLEVPRRVTGSNKTGKENEEVPLAELLPACLAWFQYCSHKLLTLAVHHYHSSAQDNPETLTLGELAQNANIEPTGGFSVARWVFWRQRLKEIYRQCSGHEVEVAEDAKRGFKLMINRGREMGFEIPGEAEYEARLQEYLTEQREKLENKKDMVWADGMSICSDEE